jgi:hypothetical protein
MLMNFPIFDVVCGFLMCLQSGQLLHYSLLFAAIHHPACQYALARENVV